MVRTLALAVTLLGFSALAQVSEDQKCQTACGQAMSACMIPCMGADPKQAANPENKDKTMTCVRGCAEQQKPCMAKCEKPEKKKAGK